MIPTFNLKNMNRFLLHTLRFSIAIALTISLSAGNALANVVSGETGAAMQQSTITGKVVSEKGEPLVGAMVIVKGTSSGAVCDVDGNFSLKASPNATLDVSYMGFLSQEVHLGGKTSVTVTLKEDALRVEDIVVVGYGSQVKANLTGAVAQVSASDIQNRPSTTLSQSIQGLVPGVTVTSSQGRPGGDGGSIRIRGVGTLNSAGPYILIDGIQAASIDMVDPNDVESMSILKDAASAAIYGSKAANGVILITTKRGKTGAPTVSYNGNAGWASPTMMIDRLDSWEYADMYTKAQVQADKSPRFTQEDINKFKAGNDPYTHPNTDWSDLAYQGSGFQQTHNFNLSGGNENVRYMGAIGYLSQKGIMENSGRKQFNARTNLDIQLTKRLLAKLNLAYINNFTQDANSTYADGSSDQIIRQVQRMAPWIVGRYDDGTYGTVSDGSPLAWLDSGQTVDRRTDNFTGSATAEYTILDGFKVSAQGSYVMNNQDYTAFVKDMQYNPNLYHGPNRLNQDFYNWNRASADVLLNYNKTFGENHKFSAMAGYHTELYKYKEAKTYRSNFPNNNLTDINAGSESTMKNSGFSRELAMESFFARVNYDYAGKYLLEANVRADASSRFSSDYRWGVFPSFSAGWRLSEEQFMSGAKGWLNNLKVRGSWGKLGNQDALDDYYPYMSTYALGKNYPFGGKLSQGAAQTAAKLEKISWEEAINWGIGLDATLWNCLTLTADYYDRRTTGILMKVEVPTTFGLDGYWDNVGEMSNRGIEFSANFNKTFGDWNVGVGGNFAYNKNEVLNLGGVSRMIDGTSIKEPGYPINSFFLYESVGIFQTQGEIDAYLKKNEFKASGKPILPGDLIYKNQNGDTKVDGDDRIIIGQPDPKWTFGLNLSAEWKGIDLQALFQGAAGVNRYFNGEVYGEFAGDTGHPSTFWRDAWTPENTNTDVPRYALYNESVSQQSQVNSTYWLSNASYLRLKNVQLGYTLPSRWTKSASISRIRIYYSGQNLFTIHNMGVNVDPESPSGRASHYPQVMVNSLGLNITF